MMKKLFIIVFVLSTGAIFSQESSNRSGGGGGFMIGYGYMDLSPLKEFLPSKYPDPSANHMLIGGMGLGYSGRMIFGGSGYAVNGSEIINDSLRVSFGGGFGFFNIGYMLVDKRQVKLYPLLGLGGGSFGLGITRTNNINVEEIQKDPDHELNVGKGGFTAEFSLNLNLIPSAHSSSENGSGGFMAGLQIGYTFSIPDNKWSYTGGDVIGGPTFGVNMFFARLVLGGFGSSL